MPNTWSLGEFNGRLECQDNTHDIIFVWQSFVSMCATTTYNYTQTYIYIHIETFQQECYYMGIHDSCMIILNFVLKYSTMFCKKAYRFCTEKGNWIFWVKCSSEGLTGMKSVFWWVDVGRIYGLRGASSPYVRHPPSLASQDHIGMVMHSNPWMLTS